MFSARTTTVMNLLAAAGALCAPARGQSILNDNFSDGQADGWRCVSFVDLFSGANHYAAFCDAASSRLQLGTHLPVPNGILEAVPAEWSSSYDPESFPLYANGRLRARIRRDNDWTDMVLVMRMQARHSADCFGDAYVFFVLASGELAVLAPGCDGAGPFLAYSDDIGFRAGQDWFLEAAALGMQLSLRAWPVGGDEPVMPQLAVEDFWYAWGGVALGVVHQPDYPDAPLSGWFDDVRFIPACAGDVNFDNAVDLGDLAVLLARFGTPSGVIYADGDLDGDGDVDLSDLAALLANFGMTCP